MGYAHFVNAIPDQRSRKLVDFVNRYSNREVAFYDNAPLDAIVEPVPQWFHDKEGSYVVMKTDKGTFAFHVELSQVVAL